MEVARTHRCSVNPQAVEDFELRHVLCESKLSCDRLQAREAWRAASPGLVSSVGKDHTESHKGVISGHGWGIATPQRLPTCLLAALSHKEMTHGDSAHSACSCRGNTRSR